MQLLDLLIRPRAWIRARCLRHLPGISLRWMRVSTAELGLAGEELAARMLLARGWRLRGRRLRTPHGEVDVLASKGKQLTVFEVKTGRLAQQVQGSAPLREARWDLRWRPGVSLSTRQAQRLHRAARALAISGSPRPRVCLIEVLVSRDGRQVEVRSPRAVLEPERGPYTRRPP